MGIKENWDAMLKQVRECERSESRWRIDADRPNVHPQVKEEFLANARRMATMAEDIRHKMLALATTADGVASKL